MLKVDITGEEALQQSLMRVEAGLADSRTPLAAVAAAISASTRERFERGGDATSGEWPDILPASRKARKGNQEAPPLTDTSALFDAATADHAGADGAVFDLSADALTKGVEGPPVRRLQEGFHGEDSRGRHIDQPARPFILITPGDEAAARDIFTLYVDGLIGAGLLGPNE